MNRRLARPLDQWLADQPGLDALLPKAERLMALQADIERYCVAVQCGSTQARESAQHDVLWIAKSPAQAAKLRNLTSGLHDHLARRGWQFRKVVVRLQPAETPNASQGPVARAPDKPGIPEARVREWQELLHTLEPGPLREAVEALVKHHGSTS